MKNILLTSIVMLSLIASVLASYKSEADKIKKVIENAYVQGIHIERDVKKIRNGFHPDFSMLILKDNEWDTMSRLPVLDNPNVRSLCSLIEWPGSSNVIANASPNSVAVS